MARTYGYNTVPGYSALAEARRRLATAPGWEWQVAGALGLTFAAGLVVGTLTRWSLLLLPILVVGLGAGLALTTARRRALVASWRQGAKGEQQTARLLAKLEREGWRVLHDLAIPGSRVNVDHLAIGPGGVWVIDSKLWGRRVHWDPRHGWMHGQAAIAPELNTTRWEVAETPPGGKPQRSSRPWSTRSAAPPGTSPATEGSSCTRPGACTASRCPAGGSSSTARRSSTPATCFRSCAPAAARRCRRRPSRSSRAWPR